MTEGTDMGENATAAAVLTQEGTGIAPTLAMYYRVRIFGLRGPNG